MQSSVTPEATPKAGALPPPAVKLQLSPVWPALQAGDLQDLLSILFADERDDVTGAVLRTPEDWLRARRANELCRCPS